MAKQPTQELKVLIARLQKQREAYLEAIAEIDTVFDQFGIKPAAAARRKTRKKVRRARKTGKRVGKKKVAKRRKRRTFKVSGPEFILSLSQKAGKKGVSGADIVKRWTAQGRRGSAYNEIGKLVRARKLRKRSVKGQRGSVYAVA